MWSLRNRLFGSVNVLVSTICAQFFKPYDLDEFKPVNSWNYQWDHYSDFQRKNHHNLVSYHKQIIFIRHGQYETKRKNPDERVLTDIGWFQAYNTGCRLREMGIKIDRIIHSDLIRARQTTAALLIGLSNDVEKMFDLPSIPYLVSPISEKLTNLSTNLLDNKMQLSTFHTVHAINSDFNSNHSNFSFEHSKMISLPYQLNDNKNNKNIFKFDLQQSHFLAEGPPPVAPEPSYRFSKSSTSRKAEGLRIENGFRIHLHRFPITKQGQIALQGESQCSIKCCELKDPRNHIIHCDCACHRITNHDPVETIVFVGHANVFRYWICRLLQLPPEAWLRLNLYHGSISCLTITQEYEFDNNNNNNSNQLFNSNDPTKGKSCVFISQFGEVGHLPRELLTS